MSEVDQAVGTAAMGVTEEDVMQLVQASTTMLVMAKKAGDVLDERFANMVNDPAHHLEAVLKKFPNPEFKWDGTLRDEHIDVEYIESPHQASGMKPTGVRMRHKFLRGGVEFVQKPTREENEARARQLLEERLRRDYPVTA